MCQTDRPDDEPLAAPVDPTAEETGLWPLPHLLDAAAADSVNPEQELARAETDQAEVTDIPPQDRGETETARPPESAADSTPRIIAAISQLGTLVEHRLTALQTLFDREIRAEATRERIVDRLHAELQEYKQDLLLRVQRPIFIDLIQLHDDIGKMIEAQPVDEPDQAAALRGTLESIRTAIEDTLYRQGVEPFQHEGEDFDPRRQRSVSTVPTDDPERNKTIAGRLRPGFQAGDKLIRPEIVSVHILEVSDCGREQSAADRRLGPAPGAHAHPPDQGVPSAGSMR
jgi:molecular chaperone GrpE